MSDKPSKTDVLLGRGVATSRHPGNEQYRSIISQHIRLYATSNKKQKTMMTRSIVHQIHNALNMPGKFLEKKAETGLWHEVDYRRALEKTAQALRDGAAPLRKQLLEDKNEPSFLDTIFDDDLSGKSSPSLSQEGKKHRRTNTAPSVFKDILSSGSASLSFKKKQLSNPCIASGVSNRNPIEVDRSNCVFEMKQSPLFASRNQPQSAQQHQAHLLQHPLRVTRKESIHVSKPQNTLPSTGFNTMDTRTPQMKKKQRSNPCIASGVSHPIEVDRSNCVFEMQHSPLFASRNQPQSAQQLQAHLLQHPLRVPREDSIHVSMPQNTLPLTGFNTMNTRTPRMKVRSLSEALMPVSRSEVPNEPICQVPPLHLLEVSESNSNPPTTEMQHHRPIRREGQNGLSFPADMTGKEHQRVYAAKRKVKNGFDFLGYYKEINNGSNFLDGSKPILSNPVRRETARATYTDDMLFLKMTAVECKYTGNIPVSGRPSPPNTYNSEGNNTKETEAAIMRDTATMTAGECKYTANIPVNGKPSPPNTYNTDENNTKETEAAIMRDTATVNEAEFAREMGPDEHFFGLCQSDPIDDVDVDAMFDMSS